MQDKEPVGTVWDALVPLVAGDEHREAITLCTLCMLPDIIERTKTGSAVMRLLATRVEDEIATVAMTNGECGWDHLDEYIDAVKQLIGCPEKTKGIGEIKLS